MPRSKRPLHDLALRYFVEGQLDLDACIIRAAEELAAQGRLRSDEVPGRLWTPPRRLDADELPVCNSRDQRL